MSFYIKLGLLLFLGWFLLIGLPSYMGPRMAMAMDCCQFNVMWMDLAKARWIKKEQKSGTDTITEAEMLAYMRKTPPRWNGARSFRNWNLEKLPICCVSDSAYVLGDATERPRCPSSHTQEYGTNWLDRALALHYGK